jgi:hypothetical protein
MSAPGVRGAWELDRWLNLLGEMVRLPLRIVGLGLELAGRTGREAQRLVGGGVQDAVKSGYAPGAVGLAAVPLVPAAILSTPTRADGAGEDLNAKPAETLNRKERHMSCSDQDLSGNDLKIINFSVVSANPYVSNPRTLYSGTISTTDDLTDSTFTGWAMAVFMQHFPEARDYPESEKQYLRICYYVQCRIQLPEANYAQKQLDALYAINKTLEGKVRREESGGALTKKGG